MQATRTDAALERYLSPQALDLQGLSTWLAALDLQSRLRVLCRLSRDDQAALFEATQGFRSLALGDLVPPALADDTPVRHYGRNSLPAFRSFEKRFVRPPGYTTVLWGYNEQRLRPITGPGYFVVEALADGELLIDYTRLPDRVPPGWPPLRSNLRGLSRFIYGGTQDVLRSLAPGISVGRASRQGKPMDNWFVLVREPFGAS